MSLTGFPFLHPGYTPYYEPSAVSIPVTIGLRIKTLVSTTSSSIGRAASRARLVTYCLIDLLCAGAHLPWVCKILFLPRDCRLKPPVPRSSPNDDSCLTVIAQSPADETTPPPCARPAEYRSLAWRRSRFAVSPAAGVITNTRAIGQQSRPIARASRYATPPASDVSRLVTACRVPSRHIPTYPRPTAPAIVLEASSPLPSSA
jgi:hypothetical protein